MSRKRVFLVLLILSFFLVLNITWFSLLFKNPYFTYYVFQVFVIGIIGLVTFGLSVYGLYKSENQSTPSLWRLIEKTMFSLSFIFVFMAWFFSGFRGTLETTLHPWAWILSITAIILVVVGLLSYTERIKKKNKEGKKA